MNQCDNSLWTAEHAVPTQYPWLDHAENCDILVIGGGVCGAMTAYRLAQDGVNTVLVAADKVGYGETSKAPAFISYETEKTIEELSQCVGQDKALECYTITKQAMESFDALMSELGENVGYTKRDSLYFSNNPESFESMKREYHLRKHNGFPVEFIDGRNSVDDFSFPIDSGIYTKGLAATFNPYLLTHALIKKACELGARAYENTGIVSVDDKSENHIAFTDTKQMITTKKIVIATGYDANGYIGGICTTRTLFNIATKPLQNTVCGWKNSCVIKNDDALAIYMSVTDDNRIIISKMESGLLTGEGKAMGCIPVKPLENRKYISLENEMRKMLASQCDIVPQYRYTSCLKSTKDGLPMIGEHDNFEEYYFALCAGVGGILFAEIAGRYITQLNKGESPQSVELFCPNRFSK